MFQFEYISEEHMDKVMSFDCSDEISVEIFLKEYATSEFRRACGVPESKDSRLAQLLLHSLQPEERWRSWIGISGSGLRSGMLRDTNADDG